MKGCGKVPTWTHLVFNAIVEADDFVDLAGLKRLLPTAKTSQLTSVIHHLVHCHAIGSVVSNGRLWWFATPETDDRTLRLEERALEEPGNRRRGRRLIRKPDDNQT